MSASMNPQNQSRRWLFLIGLMALLLPGTARADDWYMKIEGIPGELTSGPFSGWSRLASVNSLAKRDVAPDSPTFGSNQLAVVVNKALDRMSPGLLDSCGKSLQHRRASIAFVPKAPPATQYRITLEGVSVASLKQERSNSSGASIPTEQLSLNFTKIEWACLTVDELGGNTGGLTALYDRETLEGSLKNRRPFRAVIARQAGVPGIMVTCPVEKGHTYRILSCPSAGQPWTTLLEFNAPEDGDSNQFVPTASPSLLLRLEEID